MMGEETAPHSLEPQFRKLGLSTHLTRGVPTLNADHTVCKKGDTLNSNQVNLLKLFGKPLATVSPSLLFSLDVELSLITPHSHPSSKSSPVSASKSPTARCAVVSTLDLELRR